MSIEDLVKDFNPKNTIPVAEGKSKIIYPTQDDKIRLMSFKPHCRSITYNREENVPLTDYWRMLACMDFMKRTEDDGVPTQLKYNRLIEKEGNLYMVVDKITPIPIEWIVRYEAAGSIVKLFPTLVQEGEIFRRPLLKFDYKQDQTVAGVDDPTLNESYILGFGLLKNEKELIRCKKMMRRIGENIRRSLDSVEVDLIDLKMEFGYISEGNIVLIDEISQDCIRARDRITGNSITKDLFREWKSHADVAKGYETFARKLNPNIESYIREL